MRKADRDNLYLIWQQLSYRNDWKLVEDETAFLTDASLELDALSSSTRPSHRPRLAVLRAYSTLLHRGLQRRDERAAQELWLSLLRTTLRHGWPRYDAEELAQEAITHVLDKLRTLRNPQSLIPWATRILRSLEREKMAENLPDLPLEVEDDQSDLEPVDATDLAMEVEQNLVTQELQELIRVKLPNDLERLVILRIAMFGDHPRDVARDLGLPSYRLRVAKSRALKRLRADAEFIRGLSDMSDRSTNTPMSWLDEDIDK